MRRGRSFKKRRRFKNKKKAINNRGARSIGYVLL